MLSKAALVVAALALSPANALWPAPTKMSSGNDVFFIDPRVNITYNGQDVRWTPPAPNDSLAVQDAETRVTEQLQYTSGYKPAPGSQFNSKDIVQSGVSRALQGIFQNNFVPWKLRPRNSDFEPKPCGDKKWIKCIDITQTEKDDPKVFRPLAGDVDESYSLDVTEDGAVKIRCRSSTGCLHGLESFVQLFFKHSTGAFWYTPHAPVSIEDAPKFPHRGVLMDVARMWFEVDAIKRTIDAMAWNKMNRLHLHMTDSQSWPLEIPALPGLAEKGAYRKGLSYSPADLAGIYEYGVHRGVEVVLEIDMPGHIGVVELAYSDLVVAYDAKPYGWYCAEPPCGAFRMNTTKVYDFVDTLFADLLPRVAPYTAYFHTGGDELNKNDSALDPGVGSNATEVIAPLLQRFMDHAHGRVREAGLTPFVWEEMITDWNMTLGQDVVVQSWLGNGAVKKLADAGHKVVDSNYNFWVSLVLDGQRRCADGECSISTAGAASGSTLTTGRRSSRSTRSTTGAARPRAGGWCTRTTRWPGCPRRRPSRCSAARWPSGAR